MNERGLIDGLLASSRVIARGGAGVSGGTAGGEGDVDDVVADVEEDDRAGDGGAGERGGGN